MAPTSGFRVGIDASNLRLGGGIIHLAELLKAAEPAAHDIRQVTVWGGAVLLDQLATAPWLERAHDPALDGSLAVRIAWHRRRLDRLAGQSCDLLFVPGGAYNGRFRPFVTMFRNMLPFEPAERGRYGWSWMYLKQTLLGRVQGTTMRRASGVIFLNDYAKRTVERAIGSLGARTRVIPHGVDPRFAGLPRPQQPIETYSADRPFRLLYVSNIDVYKHQWQVAQAVGALRGRGLPVTLELVGSAYPPALARLTDTLRRVDPGGMAIKYIGPVTHQQMPARYLAADAFVYASTCENMPNILLEAMAAGLPIACARRGPLPDVLGEGGIYFDPENVTSIERALAELIGSPARRAALAADAHASARRYSWTRCATETFAFLNEAWSATR